MTSDLQQKLGRIKAACRRAIVLGKCATSGEAVACITGPAGNSIVLKGDTSFQIARGMDDGDAAFYAHARTFSPAAAQALLTTIEALNILACWGEGEVVTQSFDDPHSATLARGGLQHLADHWPDSAP